MTALERREKFERSHPEIDIRAKREDGRMRLYVREPGRTEPDVWTDANAMMDDLENRYPDAAAGTSTVSACESPAAGDVAGKPG